MISSSLYLRAISSIVLQSVASIFPAAPIKSGTQTVADVPWVLSARCNMQIQNNIQPVFSAP